MDSLDWDSFLASDKIQVSEAFFGFFGLVPDARIGGKHAGIDPQISYLSHEWISGGLPYVYPKRSGISCG